MAVVAGSAGWGVQQDDRATLDESTGHNVEGTPGSTPSKSEATGAETSFGTVPPSLAEAAAMGANGSGSGSGSGSNGGAPYKLSLSSSKRGGSFRRKPSMDEARAFGERRKPHRIPDASQPSGFRLARVGETEDEATGAKAEAYSMATPLRGLDTFGIGISLYFRQLYFLSGLFLLCGLVSIPAIYHNMTFNPRDTDLLARGSAAGATRGDFSLKTSMFVDFAVVLLLVIFAFISRTVGAKVAAKIDESMQTAQDYSVCILNPHPDLFDCDAYKAFFSKYGDVVAVSLALNNGRLLEAIGDKKECETRLLETVEGERLLEAEEKGHGIELQEPPAWKRVLAAVGLYSDPLFMWREREVHKARVAAAVEHQSQYSRVKRVFVIFATEAAQRRCLRSMYSGLLQSLVGGRVIASTKPGAVFRGRALLVEEPVEPSEVIWENFRYRFWRRALRFGLSFCCSGALLLASYFSLQYFSGKSGSLFSAVLISTINILLPLIVKFFSTSVEFPLTLSEMQTSILFKLAAARCINTAVLMYLVLQYDEMMLSQTMVSVMIILVTDATLAPLLQVLNLPQRIMQRFLAPRAQTQSGMNAHFQGLEWHLAERYTELSKTMFVSVFWSALLPTGFFVTAAALALNFWSDKYALFNLWRRPPQLNGRLVTLSRSILLFTIFIHVVMARVFFANWPYQHEAERARCNLFYCRETDFMTRSQVYATHFYSVLSISIFAYVLWQYTWGPTAKLVNSARKRFFVSGQGQAVDINYRDVRGIACYIPTINVKDSGSHADMFLAADLVDDFPRALVPLPRGLDVQEHNLCAGKEVPGLRARGDVARLFGAVRFYPRDDDAEARAEQAEASEASAEASAEGAGGVVSASVEVFEDAVENLGELLGNMVHTAAQPLENFLLPAETLIASNGSKAAAGGHHDDDDDDLESARGDWPQASEEEDGEFKDAGVGRGRGRGVESVLPDGWDKGRDGKFVDVTDLAETDERPTRSTGWTPWRFF